MCPDVVLSITPRIPRQKYTSEHLFLQNSFQWLLPNFSYFFKKGKKQKEFFIPPLCLIRLKSCNCIKIVKIVSIHNFEKSYSNLSSVSFKFCNIKYKNHFACFHVMLTFSVKLLQTSLITKDLIKHGNKFNSKVFHDRENSENRFSEFSYFMKCLRKYIMNISR